jgi:hypothetical protein
MDPPAVAESRLTQASLMPLLTGLIERSSGEPDPEVIRTVPAVTLLPVAPRRFCPSSGYDACS